MPREDSQFRRGGKPGPGRPKGSKNVMPMVRDLVINPVLGEAETQVLAQAAYRQTLTRAKTVLQALETTGKYTKEIGQGSDAAGTVVVPIVFMTNVDPMKLAAARSRALALPVMAGHGTNGRRA